MQTKFNKKAKVADLEKAGLSTESDSDSSSSSSSSSSSDAKDDDQAAPGAASDSKIAF